MSGALLGDVMRIGVEDDAVLAREREEALPLGAADEGEAGAARKLDAPRGKTGPRDDDRDSHAHRLDHHLRGETPGRVKNLVLRRDAVEVHIARNLVDRVVPPDVLDIDERP